MRVLALGVLAMVLVAACSAESGGEGAGSNTNWLKCDETSQCRGGRVCVAHECTPVESAPCDAGANLELVSSSTTIEARQGSYFADALYEPVFNDSEPTDWTDPVDAIELTARVTSAAGEPIPSCSVSWLVPEGSGWIYPDATATNDAGEIRARWIAGPEENQTVVAALIDAAERAKSAEVAGHALPHSPAVAPPTMPYLSVPLSEGATGVRVRVEPLAAPPQSFFATALPSFFAGPQNTSDSDAFAAEVPAENRILLASVWNVDEGNAELLWSDADVTCSPHDQGLGGISCVLPDAWQAGLAVDLIVEYRSFATDEAAPPEYADLGYEEPVCASPAGCLDYTVFLAEPEGEPRRIAGLRIQNGSLPGAFSSYIDAYGESTAPSCLEIPAYRVRYGFAELIDDAYQAIESASYGANYELWSNHVCANHGATPGQGDFTLFTGGAMLEDAPALPGDEARPLQAQ